MARSYVQHGLTPVIKALRAHGMTVIDRRTKLGRAMATGRSELEQHLGPRLSAPMASLLDHAEVTKLMLSSVDAFLVAGGKDRSHVFNKERRTLTAIAIQRQALVETHRRDMLPLGLDVQMHADDEQQIVREVQRDLRKKRNGARRKRRDGIPTLPAGETSAAETGQEST